MLPVQTPRAIGVSAVGPTRKLSFYSDYGLGAVDLTAPATAYPNSPGRYQPSGSPNFARTVPCPVEDDID